MTLQDPMFPHPSKRRSKLSKTVTIIGGSSTHGQLLPPHSQCVPRAGADDVRVSGDVFRCMRKVRVSFGSIDSDSEHCHENWAITAGANAEGGMDGEEFKKHMWTNILELHPGAASVSGKRVMIKVDGGPGRLNNQMLLTL